MVVWTTKGNTGELATIIKWDTRCSYIGVFKSRDIDAWRTLKELLYLLECDALLLAVAAEQRLLFDGVLDGAPRPPEEKVQLPDGDSPERVQRVGDLARQRALQV